MSSQSAVLFGAGRIGRGFLAPLLMDGGYAITFVEAHPPTAAALAARGGYPLRIVTNESRTEREIAPIQVIDAHRAEEIHAALAGADLVCTAVGVRALPSVTALLADGLQDRETPVDVLLCENQWRCAAMVRGLLPRPLPRVGLVETVIGRMVPSPPAEALAEDPLVVYAEPYAELPVARHHLRGPIPHVPGLIAVDNFDAYEARKLFLHNASHAALAYLGWQRGHEFIWQCAADPAIRAVAEDALDEAARAVHAAYGFSLEDLRAFAADLLDRFGNRALGDPVARVAADPLRKLRPEDRLIGAVRLCRAHGIPTTAFDRVIAAALRYDNLADPAALEMQAMRREMGDAGFLRTHCGLGEGLG